MPRDKDGRITQSASEFSVARREQWGEARPPPSAAFVYDKKSTLTFDASKSLTKSSQVHKVKPAKATWDRAPSCVSQQAGKRQLEADSWVEIGECRVSPPMWLIVTWIVCMNKMVIVTV